MNSSTLQFLVVGALIAAWAWMLGRPILTSLFRRSRRDSVGHFRYQQAVLGQSLFEDSDVGLGMASSNTDRLAKSVTGVGSSRPRPIADWRAQPIERRRLQLLLGFAIATFLSLLLAIALRGPFIRLFLLMAVCFAAYLGIAALIGASQLRRQEEEFALRQQAVADADLLSQEHQISDEFSAFDEIAVDEMAFDEIAVDEIAVDEIAVEPPAASILDGLETYGDLEHFGQGIFDEEFFEPIPELASNSADPELEFDELGLESYEVDEVSERVDDELAFDELAFDEQPAFDEEPAFDPDLAFDPGAAFDYVSPFEFKPLTEPGMPHSVLWADLEEPEQPDVVMAEAEEAVESASAEFIESSDSAGGVEPEVTAEPETAPEPTFTAAPEQRPRSPKRNKARPIYIESQLDDEADPRKAVND